MRKENIVLSAGLKSKPKNIGSGWESGWVKEKAKNTGWESGWVNEKAKKHKDLDPTQYLGYCIECNTTNLTQIDFYHLIF